MSTSTSTARRVPQWISPAALVFVAIAAVMGWGASFVGLHAYAIERMSGFAFWSGWLVPATFDGAAFGCTLVTYRASINGRSAVRGRVLMWGFTGISAWINWIHQTSSDARIVAAGLPVAAVGVFEIVLVELRADHETCHGRTPFRLRPGLLLVRLLADRVGTMATLRSQITGIPVGELMGLANTTAEHAQECGTANPTPEMSAEPEPEPASNPVPQQKSATRLPRHALDKLHAAHEDVARQGRTFQPHDVQAVVKVPDQMVYELAAEITNSHPMN